MRTTLYVWAYPAIMSFLFFFVRFLLKGYTGRLYLRNYTRHSCFLRMAVCECFFHFSYCFWD